MEESSPSAQYYSPSSVCYRNPPPEDPLHVTIPQGFPASEFIIHHSSHHHHLAYNSFHNNVAQPVPPPPPYHLMASSSSTGLVSMAGYQDGVVSLPRYVGDGSCTREMEYSTTGNGGLYPDSFHGGGYNVGLVNQNEGLALSLASNGGHNSGGGNHHPQAEVNVAAHRFGEGYDHHHHHQFYSGSVLLNEEHGTSLSGSRRSCDKTGGSYVVRATTTTMVGPLGPFTGYATILKSSRFLKPAQEVLEEWCGLATGCSSSKSRMEVGDHVVASQYSGCGAMLHSPSSAAVYGSKDGCGGGGGSQAYRPDFCDVKARLLYLLEEVCKRYKQYHQQMQMVVSSFESVAGLSSSTPYVSLAIKTVSRNFKSLKHVISDQLNHAAAAARSGQGEEERFSCSSSSVVVTPSSSSSRQLKGCYIGPNQHVWRTQRGLPERSVAILRAWLFEHFLHPYPTDGDKHMLASQTGLTRNQVSNWFINARVRVWKPMVEEIHMLESKGEPETSQSQSKSRSNNADHAVWIDHDHQYLKQEKRSRVDFQVPAAGMVNSGGGGGSLTNFLAYQGSNNGVIDRRIGGGGINGAVSLTLGLRHGVGESVGQQQQRRHGDQQVRQQYGGGGGGGMMHDFVAN